MDELKVLKARVLVLEKQMEKIRAELRGFLRPAPRHQEWTTLEDMEWDHNMAMGIDDDDLP